MKRIASDFLEFVLDPFMMVIFVALASGVMWLGKCGKYKHRDPEYQRRQMEKLGEPGRAREIFRKG